MATRITVEALGPAGWGTIAQLTDANLQLRLRRVTRASVMKFAVETAALWWRNYFADRGQLVRVMVRRVR